MLALLLDLGRWYMEGAVKPFVCPNPRDLVRHHLSQLAEYLPIQRIRSPPLTNKDADLLIAKQRTAALWPDKVKDFR
jgi:hypothetical protein